MDYFYEDEKDDWRGCLWNLIYTAVWICVIASCLFFCTGCTTTKYVTVPEYHTDTLIQTKVLKDSVWLHDSTYIHDKGDTVLVEKWHTKYSEKLVHDTLYLSKTDSVAVPYPVPEYIEKQLSWWQKLRINLGNIMLALIGIAVVYGALRLYLKFKPL